MRSDLWYPRAQDRRKNLAYLKDVDPEERADIVLISYVKILMKGYFGFNTIFSFSNLNRLAQYLQNGRVLSSKGRKNSKKVSFPGGNEKGERISY